MYSCAAQFIRILLAVMLANAPALNAYLLHSSPPSPQLMVLRLHSAESNHYSLTTYNGWMHRCAMQPDVETKSTNLSTGTTVAAPMASTTAITRQGWSPTCCNKLCLVDASSIKPAGETPHLRQHAACKLAKLQPESAGVHWDCRCTLGLPD
jgi:hypothetical protein